MTCQVCAKTDLTPQTQNCPRCGTDLNLLVQKQSAQEVPDLTDSSSPIHAIKQRSLQKGKIVELEQRNRREKQRSFGFSGLLFASWLFFFFCTCIGCGAVYLWNTAYQKQVVLLAAQLNRQTIQLKLQADALDNIARNAQITIFFGRTAQFTPPLTRTVRYVVAEGDELELVATYFFGNTLKTHKIGRDNRLPNDNKISPNDTLIITP